MDQQVSESRALSAVVASRRSTRGFLTTPVDRTVMDDIFTLAQRAPSNCNTQPWHVAVVSGQRRDALAEALTTAMSEGRMEMDFPYDGAYAGEFKTRQHQSAAALYSAMGVERDDRSARHAAFMRNFEFFGAPHAAFFFLPEPFGIREAADVGMYAQTLMLAMTAHGIASCPQTALSFHAPIVREQLQIEPQHKLLFGVAFGYPDPHHPANACRTSRAEVASAVQFHG